ncbi:MAG TPA: ATP-binding protein, partial [Spirochaetota bacterium]|nr:ATP-binding protein [Spirochaetota bacterium]
CCDDIKPIIDMNMEGDISDKVVEFEVCGRHGSRRFLRVTAQSLETLLAGASETIYLVQDITHEREIDRMKNEFISNLSHELRTPMNAILGISKMLTEKNADNLSERQKQGLTIVYESGHRLLTLINDILDLSKIEAGKMDILIRPVNTREMADRIAKIAEPLASADVSFEVEISPDVPDVVYVDEDRIQQVVINLMGNSFKFTSEGKVCLSIGRREDRIVVTVADTGIGISPDSLPFIFDRFRQGDGSMSRKYQGTGIGLSLSRELVVLMGGTISAESVYGKGTTIRFDVPIGVPVMVDQRDESPVRSSKTVCSEKENTHTRMKTLLVAEDEETGRETLRFLLSDRYHLVFAENGEKACAEFDGNRIDLVLMDIMMPGTDGYGAYDRIRKTEKGKRVPIVAVTARAMSGEREKILAYGFNDYVSKPIDSETLVETIEKLLKSHINGGSHE